MTDAATIDDYGVLIEPTTLKIQRVLPGPIERVWAYLTESELRRQWLAAGDMGKPGEDFDLTWRNDELTDPPGTRPEGMTAKSNTMTMRMTAFEPPRRLAYDWIGYGHVEFALAAQGDKVVLTLTHSRVVEPGTRLGVSAGWHAHLDLLADRLADRKSEPHWDHFTVLREDYRRRYGM